MTLAISGQNDAVTLTLTGPSDSGLAQPAQASLNAGLVATFLALHQLRVRAIALLNQAEDQAAPPAASRPGEPSGT